VTDGTEGAQGAAGAAGAASTDAAGTDDPGRGRPQPELVIVTGMSGAGRSTAANVLEDSGWYVVDNLPPHLLVELADLALTAPERAKLPRLAAVVDVRARGFFDHLQTAIDELRAKGWHPNLVFLDATDEAIVRRFESVRRPHPLQADGRLLDGINRERTMLADLRSVADVVIDTSGLNVHQLAKKVRPVFSEERGPRLRVAVMSFGFKYGIPLDADFVFDMRFLPNPFWIPELRHFTGQDAPVAEYVMGQPGAGEFVDRVVSLMEPVTAGYLREGRRYVTLAVGCTGGKHRSVAVAEALRARLASSEVGTFVVHRDLGQE
jgi:RNase adapter protein RapZ